MKASFTLPSSPAAGLPPLLCNVWPSPATHTLAITGTSLKRGKGLVPYFAGFLTWANRRSLKKDCRIPPSGDVMVGEHDRERP